MFTQQLQTSCRRSAGCKGRGAGPIWQGLCFGEEPWVWCMQSCTRPSYYRRPSAPGLPRWARRKEPQGTCKACSWCSGRKEGQLSLLLKSLASFCFSNLAFLFKFQWGMHCLSIALVVKFHPLSIIGFMTDLFSFSFSFFPLFLPGSGSCFTVDFKLYCKPCSAKYCLTLKELKRQDVVGIIPNCYSVGELSIRSSGPFHHPSESSL